MTILNGYDVETIMDRSVTLEQKAETSAESMFDQILESHLSGRREVPSLDWHHEAMKLCLDGLYPCPDTVKAVLAPEQGTTKRILDIGCGIGTWCVEMAKEFPHVEVWGVDCQDLGVYWKNDTPQNCNFRIVHPEEILSEKFNASFDMIHLRFVAESFLQFRKRMEELQQCLKPGGLFIMIDSTGELIAEDQKTVLPMKSSDIHPKGSRLQRLFYEVRHANSALGLDEFMMRITLQDGLWDYDKLEGCGAAELLMPIGTWTTHQDATRQERLRRAGKLMQLSLLSVRRNHQDILRTFGFPDSSAAIWAREIDTEIMDKESRVSLDVRILWARRRSTIGKMLLSNLDSPKVAATKNSHIVSASFPLKCIYNRKEWNTITERRQEIRGWTPDPTPFIYRERKHKSKA
ncbi:S-adenosyl-L-methionine-dependent methyltransferase [Serendipita vermifera]|nr:S-adenosyl-L-methionine-dependent methyltransferase [Serendipita vermifera]